MDVVTLNVRCKAALTCAGYLVHVVQDLQPPSPLPWIFCQLSKDHRGPFWHRKAMRKPTSPSGCKFPMQSQHNSTKKLLVLVPHERFLRTMKMLERFTCDCQKSPKRRQSKPQWRSSPTALAAQSVHMRTRLGTVDFPILPWSDGKYGISTALQQSVSLPSQPCNMKTCHSSSIMTMKAHRR